MKKKIVSVLLVMAMCAGITACGSKSTDKKSDSGSDSQKKVAVVYAGNLGDKSYNDSCNEGAKKAEKELGVKVKTLEGTTADEWEANFLAAAEGGYDLVLCSNSNFEEYLKKYAADYPDVNFAIIDTTVDADNVESISFAQNEGSFLAGAAAAMFTQKTDIEGVNADHTIGWVGGMDVPVLHDFYTGYEQGAKYIDPDVKILQSFAGSWSDPLKGKELTLAQYEQGADIVMNVASGTGTGVLEAAKEADEYAIGVDLNQDNDQPGHVLTSMVKRVDTASYEVIKSITDGSFKGGTVKYMDVAGDGVSLTDFSVMKKALGDKFPQDIVDKVNELAEKIKTGEIKVDNYEGFGESK